MGKCRDCSQCTRSTSEGCLTTLFILPFKILFFPLTLFRRTTERRCPICGHPLRYHSRDSAGRFLD
jgi:hypothetical protein